MLALARGNEVDCTDAHAVDLGALVGEVIEELLPLADAHRIDLGVHGVGRGIVAGERESLRVLVRNLVDNALRYTPAGDASTLASSAPRRCTRQRGYTLTVTDTGPAYPHSKESASSTGFIECRAARRRAAGLASRSCEVLPVITRRR
jgi:two-component system OmpR family sensor kinase